MSRNILTEVLGRTELFKLQATALSTWIDELEDSLQDARVRVVVGTEPRLAWEKSGRLWRFNLFQDGGWSLVTDSCVAVKCDAALLIPKLLEAINQRQLALIESMAVAGQIAAALQQGDSA